MKKLKVISGCLIIMAVASCTKIKEETAEEILERPKFRAEVLDEIIADDQYLHEFTDKLSVSEKGKTLCAGNVDLIRVAWESEKLDSLFNADRIMMETMINRIVSKMGSDTSTCSMMCGKVMENPSLKAYVIAHACGTTDKKNK